jgi:hypothetical protein
VIRRALVLAVLLPAAVTLALCAAPAPASASVGSGACTVAGAANRVAGGACTLLRSPGTVLSAGKKLLSGHIGSAVKTILGGGGSSSTASTALGLTAIVAWVVAGAQFSISETTNVLGETTRPELGTTWFSSAYWRIAGIAALLTLPFLFAAAVQALLRSDLALLTRAAFGYLPLAMLAVGIAAPVTMLLLAATDQLCAAVSSAVGAGGPHFDPAHIAGAIVVGASPFLRFLVATVTTAAAIMLWLELTVREAAVYVIVLMMPLAFAALVWPSRRVWAVRSVELLVALILSKLAIVAVLELGGAALDQLGHHGLGGIMSGLSGTALLLLAGLSPWAVLRLVPLTELASGAVDSLRTNAGANYRQADKIRVAGEHKLVELAAGLAARMRAEAEQAGVAARRANGADGTVLGVEESDLREGSEHAADAEPASAGRQERARAGRPEQGSSDGNGDLGPGPDGEDGHAVEERLPSLDPMFQAPNGTWRPLTLGPDGDWPYPRVWPPDTPDGAPSRAARSERAAGEVTENAARPEPDTPGEDHDPLPPRQQKPGGSL